MLDTAHLFRTKGADIKKYVAVSVGSAQFQIWQKPRGATMCYIWAVGGGGGGGAGFVGAASAAGGGGGGGSGSQCAILIPAALLPEQLYISVGYGNHTFIYASPDTSINGGMGILKVSGGSSGGTGTASAGGVGGSGGTAINFAANNLLGLGLYNYITGQQGSAGGFGAAGATLVFAGNGEVITAGSGGGGLGAAGTGGFAGGNIQGNAPLIPTVTGGAGGGGSAVAGTPGPNGSDNVVDNLFYSQGGAGGGAGGLTAGSAGANGANGGIGGLGCGGGGGGAAFTGFTAGTGGKGGTGCVIIISW